MNIRDLIPLPAGHVLLVNVHALVAMLAGLVVLVGLVWLLRGGRAAIRACVAVSALVLVLGLADGSVAQIVVGLALVAFNTWTLWSTRGRPARRGTRR